MRVLFFLLRVLVLVLVFVLVGWALAQHMITHAVAQGTPEYAVRLAAYTGGLFAGGSVATIVGIGWVLWDRHKERQREGRGE